MRMKEQSGRSTGLEPATFGTTIQRSSQLSYDRHIDGYVWIQGYYKEKLVYLVVRYNESVQNTRKDAQ